ncbi:hypothetical protein [Methylobacterium planeticum]|uniref:Terminase small subunit, Nu1 n=1 Tax=Methylobacterium planeticum TaxID=2615211 RepID=A0A6N6MDM0_9HYPH|nr:hypothetical protein [Methylobacterium planeticum]KAB1068808.1 hypothetical protein F6X51_26195 [Methylobacterium planeticum]
MTAETAPQPSRSVVSRDVAARLIMVSPKHLDRLVREGWIRKAARAQFEVVDVVQGYIRSLTSSVERHQPTAESNRVRDARATEIELRIAQRDRQLISIEEHEEVLDEVLSVTQEAAAGLPARLPAEIRQAATAEIASIFDLADRRLVELNTELRVGGVEPQDTEDHP